MQTVIIEMIHFLNTISIQLYPFLLLWSVCAMALITRIFSNSSASSHRYSLSATLSFLSYLLLSISHLTSILSSLLLPFFTLSLSISLSVDDLELLMVGTPHLDFKELENTTTYIGTHRHFLLLLLLITDYMLHVTISSL